MAYGQPPQYPQQEPMPAPGPGPRPGTVTIAVWTQILTAVVLVLTAVSMFAVASAVEDTMVDELMNDPSFDSSGITRDDISSLVTVLFALVAGLYIVFAVFYVVLGLLNYKGKRPARILSWILSGIGLLCCGFGGVINQVGSTTMSMGSTDYDDDTTQALQDATPGWVTALEWITILMLLLGSLLIIILLAMPPSNDFFRKEQPQPPFPGGPGPYPGGPGQPPYPGQQPPPPPPPQP